MKFSLRPQTQRKSNVCATFSHSAVYLEICYLSPSFQLCFFLPSNVLIMLGVAQDHKVTVSTVVQAAWGWLLSVCSGESDVVFGATVSGRAINSIPGAGDLGVDRMVGMTINTLPARVKVDPMRSVHDWLNEIQLQQACVCVGEA
jgi:hypothetical protein